MCGELASERSDRRFSTSSLQRQEQANLVADIGYRCPMSNAHAWWKLHDEIRRNASMERLNHFAPLTM